MGWFTSSDKDDDNNNKNPFNFFKNFGNSSNQSNTNSNFTSVSRVCRTDPQDNNFMVCTVKETKTQRVNDEDVRTTEEREERIPLANPGFAPVQRDNSPASPFPHDIRNISPFGPFGSDMRDVEGHFRNTLNAFFGGSNMFFNDVFKEMEKGFEQFSHEMQPKEEFEQNAHYQNMEPVNYQQAYPPNYQPTYQRPPSAFPHYNHNFKKNPSNEKDIYDV